DGRDHIQNSRRGEDGIVIDEAMHRSTPQARPPGISLALALLSMAGIIAAATPSAAQTSSHDRFRVDAVRVEVGPEVDGVLDETVWETAPVITDFVQQEPDEGAPATERTEVRVVYDEQNLYIG